MGGDKKFHLPAVEERQACGGSPAHPTEQVHGLREHGLGGEQHAAEFAQQHRATLVIPVSAVQQSDEGPRVEQELSAGARVTIGAATRFTYDPIIQCGRSIDIGEHCMVGQSTLIVDGNHRFRGLDRPMLEQGYDYSPVVLEDHAVLTTKCTVVGARIGCRSYVGAGAVVVDDIPPYSVCPSPYRWMREENFRIICEDEKLDIRESDQKDKEFGWVFEPDRQIALLKKLA